MYTAMNPMTMRRGVSIVIMCAAVLAYGLIRLHTAPANLSANALDAPSPGSASGNLSIITEPDQGIAPVIAMIKAASSSVDLVMYELEDTNVEQALAADAARGVTVRVLLNSGYYGKHESADNDAAYQYLSSNGVSVHWTPAYFALTHQKSLIVDGVTLLVMTMNLTPQYYASSREFNIVDTNQDDVSAAESAFDDDWNANEMAAGNGDDLLWSPGAENALLALINGAQKSLDIYNEEMADTKVTSALADAANRGVAVRIDMTYSSEWKTAFAGLVQAGASVRTYAANARLYIHAKVIVADDTRAYVGSQNFSSGSLQKNRELGIVVTDPSIIGSIEGTFEKDWAGATAFSL